MTAEMETTETEPMNIKTDGVQIDETLKKWLADFQTAHGRPLKVLHIGNIANNAYLNSKILNRCGIVSDVLCGPYYHIMGYPHWEDADFTGNWGDDFHPDWVQAGAGSFKVPEWFAQGPYDQCVSALLAKNGVARSRKKIPFSLRSIRQFLTRCASAILRRQEKLNTRMTNWIGKQKKKPIRVRVVKFMRFLLSCSVLPFRWYLYGFWHSLSSFSIRCSSAVLRRHDALYMRMTNWIAKQEKKPIRVRAVKFVRALLACSVLPFRWHLAIHARFSSTTQQATPAPVMHLYPFFTKHKKDFSLPWMTAFNAETEVLEDLLKIYDVVIGYATSGCYPLIMGKRPYCAFEHGTIRSMPFDGTETGKMCALTYQNADHCFITNCDNITAAKRLGLQHFSFIPHPVNEDIMVESESQELRKKLHDELDSDFIIFHPPRQHWEEQRDPNWEKGNDFLIKGLAKFIHEVDPRAGAIFIDWGKKVAESKALLKELGIENRVKWIRPLPNVQMIKYVKATDLLADQFYLGAFGSTMPKALLHGAPAMIYLDEARHQWCFPEMPPILNVQQPEEICASLTRVYKDRGFREKLIADGKRWYMQYHSNMVIAERFISAFKEIL